MREVEVLDGRTDSWSLFQTRSPINKSTQTHYIEKKQHVKNTPVKKQYTKITIVNEK